MTSKKTAMSEKRVLWRLFFGSLFLASLLAIRDIYHLALEKGFALTQPKWLGLTLVIAAMGFLAAALFAQPWRFSKMERFLDAPLRIEEKRSFKGFAFSLFLLSLFFFPAFFSQPYLASLFGNRLWIKLFLFLLLIFFDAVLLRVVGVSSEKESKTLSWMNALLTAALAQLLLTQLYFRPASTSPDYPFAIRLGRRDKPAINNASVFFGRKNS